MRIRGGNIWKKYVKKKLVLETELVKTNTSFCEAHCRNQVQSLALRANITWARELGRLPGGAARCVLYSDGTAPLRAHVCGPI